VGVIDRGQDPGFREEPGSDDTVGDEPGRELLDGHVSPQLAVTPRDDDAKGPSAQFRADVVTG